MLPTNIGMFRLTKDAVLDPSFANQVLFIMSHVIIIGCTLKIEHEAFEYTAISSLFETINEGDVIPYYVLEINTDNPEEPNLVAHKIT